MAVARRRDDQNLAVVVAVVAAQHGGGQRGGLGVGADPQQRRCLRLGAASNGFFFAGALGVLRRIDDQLPLADQAIVVEIADDQPGGGPGQFFARKLAVGIGIDQAEQGRRGGTAGSDAGIDQKGSGDAGEY